jgi:hypothetical protein
MTNVKLKTVEALAGDDQLTSANACFLRPRFGVCPVWRLNLAVTFS